MRLRYACYVVRAYREGGSKMNKDKVIALLVGGGLVVLTLAVVAYFAFSFGP
jgi:hypothetical protein